ncbi:VOC family protein [Paenibacillus koleovorans]|uniref:VOC family protein n=1 Tax=Paenibacillus koleovorans TaxID=121608 RepID=UPI000FDA6F10|nr:VOC family protein [Paenibacillus koleovorans]
MQKVIPFLMFQGQAEEAMNFYTSLIEDSEITSMKLYGPNQPGAEGSVFQATFTLKGQEVMCIDSNVKHGFTFTPSFSLYVVCDTEDEINHLYEQLSKDGKVLMPLNNYGFSRKFGWAADRFGISWQLNLL